MKLKLTCVLMGLCAVGATTAGAMDDPAKGTPYTKQNNAWIIVSGKILQARADGFTLDYGKGSVFVEMDDWDWHKEGRVLKKGMKVKVDGRVDRDEGERTSIEANSVYVEKLRTYFYASPEDEEDVPKSLSMPVSPDGVVLQGKVTKISGREFTLTNEFGEVIVDTKVLPYNPMDEDGYQQITVGSVVRVFGDVDKGILEPDEIHPVAIITLRKF